MSNLDLVNWTMREARQLSPGHHMDSDIESSPSFDNLLQVLEGERREPSPESNRSVHVQSVQRAVGRPILGPISEFPKESKPVTSDPPARVEAALSAPANHRTVAASPLLTAIVEPDIYTAPADRERAIALRWVLRDIKAKRLKLSPVDPQDLRDLINMGLVEMRNDAPVLTNAGVSALVQ
jgi:hypothetical protein